MSALTRLRWRLSFLWHYARSLHERANVEAELLDVANGKRPLPDREQCRAWALRLGQTSARP